MKNIIFLRNKTFYFAPISDELKPLSKKISTNYIKEYQFEIMNHIN